MPFWMALTARDRNARVLASFASGGVSVEPLVNPQSVKQQGEEEEGCRVQLSTRKRRWQSWMRGP